MAYPLRTRVSIVLLVAGALLAVMLVIGLIAEADGRTLALMALIVVIGALGGLAWMLVGRVHQRERHTRQLRFVADRLQAMVRALPGGYCLFTPQGILREEYGIASRLGLAKIGHFDTLAGAVKDGPELVEHFRQLQRTGEGFSLHTSAVDRDVELQITGRRFRIGRDGPPVDVLWFGEVPTVSKKILEQISGLAAAETSAKERQTMLDALPFPVWARTKDLKLAFCNLAYAKAMDATTEAVQRDQIELMSLTARSGSGRGLAANALSRGEAQSERRHVIIAGRRKLLEITEVPCPAKPDEKADANPHALRLVGLAIDVTAEEDRETELQRHLAAHHEVMEHLGTAIAIYGPDTRLEFYNRAYQRLWDAEESFLDGKPTFGEILEDMRTRRRGPEQADFQRYKKERLALFTSLLEPREDLMHLPDGTSLRILAVPHPFGGLMFVHEDVTDRLALESSYNTLIAVQRESLDNLAEGIAVYGPDGKLRLSNPAFARIWKLSEEYLTETPHITDLLERMKPLFSFGDDWTAFKSTMVTMALDRNPRGGRLERADQAIVEYRTVPLPDGAVLNSFLDVTDTVRIEQALRASNAALAAADRLKSEFVANVSYQLRTPLNTITGFADILAEQYFGTLNEKQMEYTRTIKAASESLLLLINDVLDLATIEAGRMALEIKTLSAASFLGDVRTMALDWARQQDLDIAIDVADEAGSMDIDETRMKQVMFNLVSNAVKYTPQGGRITLGARRDDAWVVLSVSDTGIGIPEPDLDRVFGKFERTNFQARQSGAGLGLSLVKSLVELHGGHVEIKSSVNKGTTVRCYLPRATTASATAVEAEVQSA